jgi:hypothetical protein
MSAYRTIIVFPQKVSQIKWIVSVFARSNGNIITMKNSKAKSIRFYNYIHWAVITSLPTRVNNGLRQK